MQQFTLLSLDIRDLTFDSGENYPCKEWIETYTVTRGVVYGIAFFISILTYCMRKIVQWLTRTEGHHTVTAELTSITRKVWMFQFVNTALVLLIINSRFS